MGTAGGPSLADVEALIGHLTEHSDIAGASVFEFCERERGDANRVSRADSTLFTERTSAHAAPDSLAQHLDHMSG